MRVIKFMKKEISKILRKPLKKIGLKLEREEIEKYVEIPPSPDLGDFAFPCFAIANRLKENPHDIAIRIREKIKRVPYIFEEISVVGPYINFYLNRKIIFYELLKEILKRREKFGKSNLGKRKTIVVEFSSPNIARRFGIGHIRSTIIGNAIANLCKFQGFTVKRINYLGDWGTQFGKLILGYKKFGKPEKFKKDPISHLQEIYVKVNKNKKYLEEAKKEFKKLEEGDRENLLLWRLFRDVSLKEFEKTYKLLGIEFDEIASESEANKLVNKVIEELKEKKIAKKSRGALVVHLKKYGLGTAIIKKSDDTTIYCTRDLAEAIRRYRKFKFEKMIYEVGQEQTLHFKQLFKILEMMGYEWAKRCIHISHGLYLGKDGKKFSTRKGKTAHLEEIIEECKKYAKAEIKKRFPNLKEEEVERRGLKVALAAIFYGDLKNHRMRNIIFDIERFTSFDGNTGPYILYTYARASSILKNTKAKTKLEKIESLDENEIQILKLLEIFPERARKAFEELDPSIVANYVYELCKKFNEFYHACRVLGSEKESLRLAIVEAFRQVTRNACKILGIQLLDEM